MQIAASLLAGLERPWAETARELERYGVDFLHLDYRGDCVPESLEIPELRKQVRLPLDLHLITDKPSGWIDFLAELPAEQVCFQVENLPTDFRLPARPKKDNTRWGLAWQMDSPPSLLEPHLTDADYLLLMTTTPGVSGGSFPRKAFAMVRHIQLQFPGLPIHVDGGVTAEVAFILRTMGVPQVVVGSYLMRAEDIFQALTRLRKNWVSSDFPLSDWLMPADRLPILAENKLTFRQLLETIENYRLGFCLVTDSKNRLKGIVTNADLRRGMLRNIEKLREPLLTDFINPDPFYMFADETVSALIDRIRRNSFPILYFPVLNRDRTVAGAITFQHLIQAEL